MKRSASREQNKVGRLAAGNAGKRATRPGSTAKAIKLSPSKRVQSAEPVALLEQEFPDSEVRAVTFDYYNPDAHEVLLAGTFNNWQPQATPLTPQRGGKWSAELLLKPGQYEYRFVVDGQWQDDPMSERYVANPFGGLNCVRDVKTCEALPAQSQASRTT